MVTTYGVVALCTNKAPNIIEDVGKPKTSVAKPADTTKEAIFMAD